MIGWCCTNFLKVAVFSSCFRLLNHLYLGATLANLNWECLAEIDPPLASTSRIGCWTGTPWEHPWFMLRTSISIYQYLTSVEAILKRICFVLEVLNITITHHQGFRHVHHGLLGKIMSHLGSTHCPQKRISSFCSAMASASVTLLELESISSSSWEGGKAQPQSSSQCGILYTLSGHTYFFKATQSSHTEHCRDWVHLRIQLISMSHGS